MVRPSGDQRGEVSLPPFLVEQTPLAARHVDHPHVAAPAVVGGRVRPCLEDNLPGIGRPVGVGHREVALGQAPRLRRLDVVQPEVGHLEQSVDHLGVTLFSPALLFRFGERVARGEQQGGTVRRERERAHRLVVPGHLPRLAAVGVQEMDLRLRVCLLAAGGQKGDDRSVGRPRRRGGVLRTARELPVAGPVDADAPEVGDRRQVVGVHVARPERVGDPLAVGRQIGRADLVDAQGVAGRQDPRPGVLLRQGTARGDERHARGRDGGPQSPTSHVNTPCSGLCRDLQQAHPQRHGAPWSHGPPAAVWATGVAATPSSPVPHRTGDRTASPAGSFVSSYIGCWIWSTS